jgi:hypothetical protein
LSTERQKAIGGLEFSNEQTAAGLQPDSHFDNLKRHPQRNIFKYVSWIKGSFFSGDDWDILKEGVKIYPMEHQLSFHVCIYSLRPQQWVNEVDNTSTISRKVFGDSEILLLFTADF